VFSEENAHGRTEPAWSGCRFLSKTDADQELVLRSLESNQEAEIRIVGEIRCRKTAGTTYGVGFSTTSGFSGTWISDATFPDRTAAELLLECSGCSFDRDAAERD